MAGRAMLTLIGFVLAMPGAATAAGFGPGEAAGSPRPGQAVQSRTTRGDFIVLIWYRRNDPLTTFQYQVYDVRKGEYTPAVDAWIQDVQSKYPAYLVLVRTVDLRSVPGRTESLKVGSVIHRELMVAAAQSGVLLGGRLEIGPGPSQLGQGQPPRANRIPGMIGVDRSFLNPSPLSFPVPMPYPRPHP
jgi:hypothetical protein